MNAKKKSAMTARIASIATTLALVAFPGATLGATISWLPDEDGFWDLPGNWSSNPALPGAGDDVTINVGGAVVRIITHRIGTSTIRTINNAETVDVTNGSTLQISSGGLGSTNTGTLRANNGTLNLIQSTLNNAGGTLSAINGGRINLSNGTVVSGGTLSTATSGAIQTALGSTATLNGVTLASGAQYIGSNASATTLIGTINNAGLITLSSGGNATDLVLNGTVTLTGGGGVLMGNNINNRIRGSAGSRLVNDVGHTIQGGGQIGVDSIAITNAGLIVSNQPSGLEINPNATGMINTGTLRASGGATLNLTGSGGGGINNTGGTIEAQAGSTVRLFGGVVISGGTLMTSGSGIITTPIGGAVQESATLSGVTVSSGSHFVGATNSQTTLLGTITNNGTMTLASTGLAADFVLSGDVTLTGSGLVSLGDNAANRILGGAGSRLINDATHTIAGSGQVGAQQIAITNAGLIVANQATALVIDPNATGMINSGTVRATNSATLTLTGNGGGGFDNTNGTIEAQAGSTVRLTSGAVIAGGTLTTSGSGVITTPSGGAVQDTATLNGVTVSSGSRFVGADNSQTTLLNTITNHGTMELASTGNGADLFISGDVILTGGGAVLMGNHINNRIRGGASGRLINDATHTIAGSGQIGSQQIALTNAGLIVANQATELVVDPNASGMINTGTLRATNSAVLYLTGNGGGGFNNAGGTIEAQTGSTVRLVDGAVITGGTLTTSGSGVITTPSGGAVQNGATLNAVTISSGSQFVGADNSQTTLLNTITNHGTMALASTGLAADLFISGDVTLTGGGAVLMGNHLGNRIRGGASGRLINDATHTIAGSGQIGAQQIAITNAGLIVANQATELVVDPNASGMINTGTLRATNGATLFLTGNGGGGFNNTGGTIEAQTGSTVRLVDGAIIAGGTLTTSGSGIILTPGGGAAQNGATLDGVMLTGGSRFVGADNSVTTLRNTITNNGTMTLASTGPAADLYVIGDVTLAGNGAVSLGNSLGNRIFGSAGSSLTNAAGHVIVGGGQIGLGAIGLNNQGVIAANQPVGLIINTSSTIVNSGTLQANDGSALTLARTVNNSGTILANGGTVNANAGFTGATGTARVEGAGSIVVGTSSSVGNLVLNGTGTLALGTNNITVHSDYNNANFGIGNSFNARSGVTGTGVISAAGNVAQAITGANITSGTTGTATLTIGNVRVGANTYQLRTSPTPARRVPALRGALQTAVNGGNITDARLSGTGVTESNWGPVAAGGSSGNLNVTFTTATAGALTPLAGQTVHIANNFGNLGAQNLNIVLQGGAAAYNAAAGSATPSPVVLANQRVGGSASQVLTVANTAAAGAFSEDLNASFGASTGNATSTGAIGGRLAGTNNTGTGSMTVGVNTSTAGARSGSVTLNYQTAGAVGGVSNGLGVAEVGSQTITVSGNVYQVAAGQIVTAPLNFGTVQVGQLVSQNLVIRNSATGAAGFVEDLNASFGAAGDARISGAGALTGILAGASSTAANGAMTVSVNTAAAGAINSSIGVNFASAGAVNGVSNGLGTLGVGSENYGVSGTIQANVINTASPVINTPTIALGNVRVGDTVATQNVSVTNQATVAPQAALNASISTAAPLTATGSFELLAPGATNNTSLQVGMTTATAGSRNGTATVALVSDASNVGNCAPNCQFALPSQTVNITGGVYQIAQANVPTTVNLGNVHVGGALSQAITIGNTSIAPAGFQEGLDVAVGGTSGGATATGGPIANLAAGGTSNAITVGLAGIGAGNQSGQVSLNLASNGTGTSGLATLNLGAQAVTVNAVGYSLAQASVTPTPVTLANQRIGGTGSQALTVANLAPNSAFTETLSASFGANSGNALNNGGSIGGIAGGASNSAALAVGVNTSAAGARSGTVTVNLASNEVNSSGLGTTALAPQTITVSGNVYQVAAGQIVTAPLNFGTVQVGQLVSQNLVIRNSATGAAGFVEDLNASFGAAGDARISGAGALTGILAGASSTAANGAMTVSVNTAAAGAINSSIGVNFASAGAVNGVSNGLGTLGVGFETTASAAPSRPTSSTPRAR